jgi:hypothetical protein
VVIVKIRIAFISITITPNMDVRAIVRLGLDYQEENHPLM